MDVTELLDSLNESQRDAVCSESKRLLVLAGAGSGKTRVLVHRIAWMIATENLSPFNILAVTFTNKAAAEMRHRIELLLGMSVSAMWVGTFHSIAHRLLRNHYKEAGLPEGFEILDAEDQLRLVRRVMKEMDIDDGKFPPKQVQWWINGRKDEGLRSRHLEHHGDFYLETMIRIYRRYEEHCQRSGLVDFNELLLRALELWRDNEDILQHYRKRFRHILVDEFQDTNAVQYAWLQLLGNAGNGVTIVGDDDQSIYGWRGARIENIHRFSEDFRPVDTIRLEQNYRSTSTILNAANTVIANNADRLGKNLWTEGEEGEPIRLFAGFNDLDEAQFVVEQAMSLLNTGVANSDIAILYRSNAQSRVLEEAFIREGIPYRIYGGFKFFERAEIKNVLAYLRLVNNRHADSSFERVINTPTRGIGQKTIEAIRLKAREQDTSLWQAACDLVNHSGLTSRAAGAVRNFLELVNRLDEETKGLDLSEQAEHVMHGSGIYEFHKKEKGEKGLQRIENLKELISATKEFDTDEEGADVLTAFLDHAMLEAGEAQAEEFEDSVQMMTLHSAKGLEFPVVFMVGLEEGLFPHQMSMDDPGGLEEERRLCYVGITRAMKQLYLCYAESRRQWGNETYNPPSRFLREIPGELVQEVRFRSDISKPSSLAHHTAEENGYQLGSRVMHKKYGEGVVLNCEGNGPNMRVQVNFEADGVKWLVHQYAGLESL